MAFDRNRSTLTGFEGAVSLQEKDYCVYLNMYVAFSVPFSSKFHFKLINKHCLNLRSSVGYTE